MTARDRAGHRAWVRHLMGMPVSIHLRGPAPEAAAVVEAVEGAYAELARVEDVFSLYRPDSALSRVRRQEITVADCPPEVAEVLGLCQQASRRTGGWFAWELPDAEGVRRVEPTGLVKGWAIARAAAHLGAVADHAYCLNAGGDIAVGGRDASESGERPWRLGIEDPRDRSRVAHVVELREGAVATSGTAARGPHLIDPVSGRAVDRPGSVTVVGPSVVWADVWATALFVGPRELVGGLTRAEAWQVIRL